MGITSFWTVPQIHCFMATSTVRRADAKEQESSPRTSFNEGDLVWEKKDKPGKSISKFKASWSGPFIVVGKSSEVSYWVRPVYGDGAVRKIHVAHLKRYIPKSALRKDADSMKTKDDATLAHDLARLMDTRGDDNAYQRLVTLSSRGRPAPSFVVPEDVVEAIRAKDSGGLASGFRKVFDKEILYGAIIVR